MIASLNQLLKEQGYNLVNGMDKTIISRSITGSLILLIIFTIVGGLTVYISLDLGHSYAHFIGFGIMVIPYAIDKKRFPNLVSFDPAKKEIRLRSGFFFKKVFSYDQIKDIVVDESVLSSDTSPFKEGNKDYIYSFYLNDQSSQHKLLRIQYRKPMDEEVKVFIEFFDRAVNAK